MVKDGGMIARRKAAEEEAAGVMQSEARQRLSAERARGEREESELKSEMSGIESGARRRSRGKQEKRDIQNRG